MKRRQILLGLPGLVAGAAIAQGVVTPATPGPSVAAAPTMNAPEVLRALRAGGLVIYFRHTATDFSKRDDAMNAYDDCANQRLLSPQGRIDARQLGVHIRALRLPVDEVLASPMCRTMEHARLTFGRAAPTLELREGDQGDYPGLKRWLREPVAPRTLRWIVGHGTPFRAVIGFQLAEGEAAILRPNAPQATMLARVTIDQWPSLLAVR